MKELAENLLVILPGRCIYKSRTGYLSNAHVNLAEFFRQRHEMETHIISSAESCRAVPVPEGVKTVQAVHPGDFEFFKHNVMPLGPQDIQYHDAFDAAAKILPLVRGLSVEERLIAAAVREKAAVRHIVRNHYEMVVSFEHPRRSVYHASPSMAKIFFRVSTVDFTVEAFVMGKPVDLCVLLRYNGANKPLGAWDEGGCYYAAS